MSKGTTPNVEDLSPVSDDTDDDAPKLELDPGDSFVGEVRSIERNLGQYESTLVHFSTEQLGEQRKMWLPGHVDAQFYQADIEEGQIVGLVKDDEPTTTETDDGEEVEYHRIEVRT